MSRPASTYASGISASPDAVFVIMMTTLNPHAMAIIGAIPRPMIEIRRG